MEGTPEEESQGHAGKTGAEHSYVHAFAQPPQDNDHIETPVLNPVVQKPVQKPAFKIYPGMPEDVRKIVEEYNAKGTFASNFPEEGFVTPHVSTHLSFGQMQQSPVKTHTSYKYVEKNLEASPGICLNSLPLTTICYHIELPLRQFLINSINENLKKSPVTSLN